MHYKQTLLRCIIQCIFKVFGCSILQHTAISGFDIGPPKALVLLLLCLCFQQLQFCQRVHCLILVWCHLYDFIANLFSNSRILVTLLQRRAIQINLYFTHTICTISCTLHIPVSAYCVAHVYDSKSISTGYATASLKLLWFENVK